MDRGWDPILPGDMAQRAQLAISDVAADLESSLEGSPEGAVVTGPGLAHGHAGVALFFGYLALTGDSRARELCSRFMERSLSGATSAPIDASLYSGLSGVAWAGTHLARLGVLDSAEDPYSDVDRALLEHVSATPWQSEYDLVSGLAGIGLYALERMPRPAARNLLAAVVARLIETAERSAGEAKWFTSPELLPAESIERYPTGFYNLGVAHGLPGVVAVVAGGLSAGVGGAEARVLLADALGALLRHRAHGAQQCFPAALDPDLNPSPSRTGWCYGDPGISAALLAASFAIGDAGLRDEAVQVAEVAAKLPHHLSGVRDAGLCHGSAGVAHLFNRVHQATGSETLREGAVGWFAEVLQHRRPGWGVGGFKVYTPSLEKAWNDDPGFLVGAAGIGLALFAGTTAIEPSWDALLLASLPDGGRLPRNGEATIEPALR